MGQGARSPPRTVTSESFGDACYGGRSGVAPGVPEGAGSWSRPPPIARPLPFGRLTDGADRRVMMASSAPLGLAQDWGPRGGARLKGGGVLDVSPGFAGRRRVPGVGVVPATVMFGKEWGRKREWRRSGYNDDDIDPMMTSCFFRKPANSTGVLKRSDEDQGGADFEEMDLVRRIRSFRERR